MKKILLGNEAIIQGALEAGVGFVSGYPGCPSAEIGDGFAKIAKNYGVYSEWSTNEKVALEAAIGASFSGVKSLVNMKSFGINVCSDSLLPLAYTGTRGAMVVVVADDPSCWSSAQSEQNSRAYAYLSRLPMLEPADPQECYEFTVLAFEISEKFNLPVILRITTRVAHQKMPVSFKGLLEGAKNQKTGEFVKNKRQYVTLPPRVLEMKKELLEKIGTVRQFSEKSKANIQSGEKGKIGIISSGVSHLHAKEAMSRLERELPVLKLGFFYPLPEKKIRDFIKNFKKILIIEELDPYVEKEVARIAKDANPKLEIFGKNILPETGELDSEKILQALCKVLDIKYKKPANLLNPESFGFVIPTRTAKLCLGCPYWYVFPTLKRIAPNAIFAGDIGCNMIAALPPHQMEDFTFSMGASMGISHGIKKVTNQKVVSIMGDGTFFHAGIPALLNAVYNKSGPLLIILDNRITAMTGHQNNPGMGKTSMGEDAEEIKIEEIAKACGVKHIKVLDPINIKELENSVNEFMGKEEISIIICRRICALLAKRQKQ